MIIPSSIYKLPYFLEDFLFKSIKVIYKSAITFRTQNSVGTLKPLYLARKVRMKIDGNVLLRLILLGIYWILVFALTNCTIQIVAQCAKLILEYNLK